MLAESDLHQRQVLAQLVGFAQRLFVVVSDRGQERRHLDLVEAAERRSETLLSEVQGTYVHTDLSSRAFPLIGPSRGGRQRPGQTARRPPKIAVPTRISVAPSSIATSKSWLMPIDSSPSIAAATPWESRSSLTARRA